MELPSFSSGNAGSNFLPFKDWAFNIVVTYSPKKAQLALHLLPGPTSSSKDLLTRVILFCSSHHQPGTKDLNYILKSTCPNQLLKTKKPALLSDLLKMSYYHLSEIPILNTSEQSDFYVPTEWTTAKVLTLWWKEDLY